MSGPSLSLVRGGSYDLRPLPQRVLRVWTLSRSARSPVARPRGSRRSVPPQPEGGLSLGAGPTRVAPRAPTVSSARPAHIELAARPARGRKGEGLKEEGEGADEGGPPDWSRRSGGGGRAYGARVRGGRVAPLRLHPRPWPRPQPPPHPPFSVVARRSLHQRHRVTCTDLPLRPGRRPTPARRGVRSRERGPTSRTKHGAATA